MILHDGFDLLTQPVVRLRKAKRVPNGIRRVQSGPLHCTELHRMNFHSSPRRCSAANRSAGGSRLSCSVLIGCFENCRTPRAGVHGPQRGFPVAECNLDLWGCRHSGGSLSTVAAYRPPCLPGCIAKIGFSHQCRPGVLSRAAPPEIDPWKAPLVDARRQRDHGDRLVHRTQPAGGPFRVEGCRLTAQTWAAPNHATGSCQSGGERAVPRIRKCPCYSQPR